ncbi:MAG: hypothetical protein IPG45_07235 [Deltaproteobacteria bacterium]|nr:hypothetical protein [Deltaproteobacteria bacterium]
MAGESAVAKNGKPESTGKVLSITELELQFAQNPDSIAYVPLCEAYIAQGRFMEAMVVCKKSIKAHPQAAEPRILLARVYAEQKNTNAASKSSTSCCNNSPAPRRPCWPGASCTCWPVRPNLASSI